MEDIKTWRPVGSHGISEDLEKNITVEDIFAASSIYDTVATILNWRNMLSYLAASAFLATVCWSAPTIKRGNQTHLPGTTHKTGSPNELRFKEDGTFQLSIFQDLHFGENAWDAWGPEQDANTLQVMRSVLDNDRPDLVVLNGDLTTGENLFLENSTDYVDMMVSPMVERSLPWASTYGNHDHQYNITGSTILEREHQYPNALTNQMFSSENFDAGVSNYYLPVYAADCQNGKLCAPELLLWFFDSRGGHRYQEKMDPESESASLIANPNWVHPEVVDWFQTTNAQITARHGNKTIPSLAFVHIPPHASRTVQEEGIDPSLQPGTDNDDPLAQQAQGWCPDGTIADDCPYGGQDAPFMDAISTTPGLMALISGHDHGNTWCQKYRPNSPLPSTHGNGVSLCFGQHTGYGGYSDWVRGARQVLVSKDMLSDLSVDTWNLLEDGRSVGSITLNATYGYDVYPEVPNDTSYCGDCDYVNTESTPGS